MSEIGLEDRVRLADAPVRRPLPPSGTSPMQELDETALWAPGQPILDRSNRRAWLTVITGPEAGRVYNLPIGRTSIGRDLGADVRLDEGQISREHTELELREDGSASVRDCGSKNGTLLGSRSVGELPHPLHDGAKLQVGGAVVLRFNFRDTLEEVYERKLYHSATRADLPGLYNKQHFATCLEREHQQAQRHGRPVCLVLLDLDDFKTINDSHGHAAGDHVLFEVAVRLQDELRGDELLARFGGEEFVVLLSQTELRKALAVAERLRCLIEGAVITWNGQRLPVTASFGVSSTAGRRTAASSELFRIADESLYRAKHCGKNRVCGPLAGRR